MSEMADLILNVEDLYDHNWIKECAVRINSIEDLDSLLPAARNWLRSSDPVSFVRKFSRMLIFHINDKSKTSKPEWFKQSFELCVDALDKLRNNMEFDISSDGDVCLSMDFPQFDELSSASALNTTVTTTATYHLRNSIRVIVFLLTRFIVARQRLLKTSRRPTSTSLEILRADDKSDKTYNIKGFPTQCLMRALNSLNDVLTEKITDLWHNEPVDAEFLCLLVSPFFREFEHGTMVKNKSFNNLFVQIMQTLSIRFEFSEDISKRLANSFMFEDCSPLVVSDCVKSINSHCDHFLDSLIQYSWLTSAELKNKKTVLTFFKNFQLFIDDIAHVVPNELLQSVDIVAKFQQSECYIARISVICALGAIMENYLQQRADSEENAIIIDAFLVTFLSSLKDSNMYVRSQTLQICKRLAFARVITSKRQLEFALEVAKRVSDQSSLVRRHSLNAIFTFATHNCFTSNLDCTYWKQKLDDEMKKVEMKMRSNCRRSSSITESTSYHDSNDPTDPQLPGNTEDGIDHIINDQGGTTSNHVVDSASIEGEDDVIADHESEHFQLIVVRKIRSTLSFIEIILSTIPQTVLMLRSQIQSDVTCALDFLVKCFCQLKIDRARSAVGGCLHLIWHPEKVVRDSVVNAFVKLHLDPTDMNGDRSVQMLMGSIDSINRSGLLSIEVILSELFERKQLNDEIGNRILTIAQQKNTTRDQKFHAFVLLNLLNRRRFKWIKQHFQRIVNCGLSNINDLAIMGECYHLLCGLSTATTDNNTKTSEKFDLLLIGDHIFKVGIQAGIKAFDTASLNDWKCLIGQFLPAIGSLSDNPIQTLELFTLKIVQQMKVLDKDAATGENADSESSTICNIRSDRLSKYCYYLGMAALTILSYTEGRYVDIVKSLQLDESSFNLGSTSNDVSSLFTRNPHEGDNFDQFHDDTDEIRFECKRMLAENAFCEGSILSVGLELILQVIANESNGFDDPILQYEAHLALIRLLLICPKMINTHLKGIFVFLEAKCIDPTETLIKTSIIMLIGELSMRYPNIMEPWNTRVYKLLRDGSKDVRIATLRVLSRLVLREMIKMRGQISEVAICVIDPDSSIRSLSRYFFEELAKRSSGDAIYNVFSDVLSRLSDIELGISHDKVISVLSFLASFISKDKQRENLVVRLCQRMRIATEAKQWADIAYCLTLIVQSESTFKKLLELFPVYGDRLLDNQVYNYFRNLVHARRRCGKQTSKIALEEFSEQIERVRNAGLDGFNENAFSTSSLKWGKKNKSKRQQKAPELSTAAKRSRRVGTGK